MWLTCSEHLGLHIAALMVIYTKIHISTVYTLQVKSDMIGSNFKLGKLATRYADYS